MIFDENRFEGVPETTKIIMLEAENDVMQTILSEALDSLVSIECEVQNLRQALYLELPDTD